MSKRGQLQSQFNAVWYRFLSGRENELTEGVQVTASAVGLTVFPYQAVMIADAYQAQHQKNGTAEEIISWFLGETDNNGV